VSLPPRERPARFAEISLVPRAGPLVIAVLACRSLLSARGLPAPKRPRHAPALLSRTRALNSLAHARSARAAPRARSARAAAASL
jgi:hypothetical protein